MKRLPRTLGGSVIGGLGGFLTEKLVQAATGLDIADGALEILGAVVGVVRANQDLLQALNEEVAHITGKNLDELSERDWEKLRLKYPSVVQKLEKALQV